MPQTRAAPSSLPSHMQACAFREPGGPEVLQSVQRPLPTPQPDEVLIQVHYAGINGPDAAQRKGAYPPPPGASDLPGLEVSGIVAARGSQVSRWQIGDRICALLSGGGYAEYAAAPEGQCLAVPAAISLQEAAGLPETVLTVWSNVFERGALAAGETLLIHGGTSGIGTTALALAKLRHAKVFVTAGSDEKTQFCLKKGADAAINYRTEDFAARVKELTAGKGVDVILDMVGGSYLERNIASLARGGRLAVIALQGGSEGKLDLRRLLSQHLTVTASTLRPRSVAEKSRLVGEVERAVWPLVASRQFVPHIDRVFPLAEAAAAHALLDSGRHFGKILLAMPAAQSKTP